MGCCISRCISKDDDDTGDVGDPITRGEAENARDTNGPDLIEYIVNRPGVQVINLGSGRYIEYEPESSERYIPLEYNRDGTEMEKVEAEISISDDQTQPSTTGELKMAIAATTESEESTAETAVESTAHLESMSGSETERLDEDVSREVEPSTNCNLNMITVVIDGGEGNRGESGEQLTEDTPTAATENEYVAEALPLPHPPLW